jgi:hypothetical protein
MKMIKRAQSTAGVPADSQMDLSHLRREARTALELAVVTLAPSALVDRLATAAGLLEALVELPVDSAPVVAIVPRVVTSARSALEDWQKWHDDHLEGKMPRG